MKEIISSFDLKGIIIFVISAAIFRAILGILNTRSPETFNFLKKIPDSWKGKWYIRWGTFMVLIFLLSISVVYLRLNSEFSWIIAGFFSAFTDFIFFKPNQANSNR